MAVRKVISKVYRVALGVVNAYLIDDRPGSGDLVLIDAGPAGSTGRIVEAIRRLGRQPHEVRGILITHCHPDHSGGLAEIRRATGAEVWMHAADASLLSRGRSARALYPGPGLANRLMFNVIVSAGPVAVEPVVPEHQPAGEAAIDLAGGLQAVPTPGHTEGSLAFLWPTGNGVLFTGDTAGNMFGLNYGILFEDLSQGRRDLARLSRLSFATACFGHGRPIRRRANARFRRRWAGQDG